MQLLILISSDFLKLDIEYAEFGSITAFLKDLAGQELPFGQLLIEIHLFKDKITARDFLSWQVLAYNHPTFN